MRVARGLNFRKTVTEIDMFKNYSDKDSVISDSIKDEFIAKDCIEDRRPLFKKDRSS